MIIITGISSIGAFTRAGGDYYLTPVPSIAFERQIEFLRILYNHNPSEDSDAPNVVAITIPESEQEIFYITIDEEPTAEIVQFILDFTGISYEKAKIFKTNES